MSRYGRFAGLALIVVMVIGATKGKNLIFYVEIMFWVLLAAVIAGIVAVSCRAYRVYHPRYAVPAYEPLSVIAVKSEPVAVEKPYKALESRAAIAPASGDVRELTGR